MSEREHFHIDICIFIILKPSSFKTALLHERNYQGQESVKKMFDICLSVKSFQIFFPVLE